MDKSNVFIKKMAKKSTESLESIIKDQSEYHQEAIEAAQWELEKRAKGIIDKQAGEDRYRDFIKSIPKKQSFGFTPVYEEAFQTDVPFSLIYALTIIAFERLEWDIVYNSEWQVEAKRRRGIDATWGEKITIGIEKNGRVNVSSASLQNNFMDLGRNSIRVKLFIHAFNEVANEHDSQKFEELSVQVERQKNWDNYEIPNSLPKPEINRKPTIVFLILSGFISSILLGGIFAFAASNLYIVFLYEVVLGIALGFLIYQGVKLGNYTNGAIILTVVPLTVLSIVILNQYFQYLLIDDKFVSFFQFLTLKFKAGFIIEGINTGWIGWLVVLVFQLLIIFAACYLKLFSNLSKFIINRVPEEVVLFATYLLAQGKDEEQIRKELSTKGWNDPLAQDFVFDALEAIYNVNEYNRG